MRIMGTVKGIAAIGACFVCGMFAYALTRSPVFDGKDYELYTGTSSDEIIVTDTPAIDKFVTTVAGESARWEGDRAAELVARFEAKILFVEETCGITNLYCYAPQLGGGIALGGEVVNLHIASDGSCTVAGTPIIFGGF